MTHTDITPYWSDVPYHNYILPYPTVFIYHRYGIELESYKLYTL